MRVVLTGGGTGGHIIPFEGMIAGLRQHFFDTHETLPSRLGKQTIEIYFLGVDTPAARETFSKYDVPLVSIPAGKLRRYFSWRTIIDVLFKVPAGLLFALFHLYRLMPDVVISKGGYGSFPTVVAAAFYRIPILLHESDVQPGLTNVRLARLASAIAVGFTEARSRYGKWQYKTVLTGTPARLELENITSKEAKAYFDIPPSEHVVLVFGGSQGAEQINEILITILPRLLLEAAVIHITGPDHYTAVSTVAKEILAQSSRKHLYKVYAYLGKEMRAALVAADSIVSRAGATVLAEIARLRKPALLIPLPGAASDHQRLNAQAFEAAGAALVLEPNNVSPHLFERNLERLIHDQEARSRLIANVTQMDHPEAAQKIAELAFTLAKGLAPGKSR